MTVNNYDSYDDNDVDENGKILFVLFIDSSCSIEYNNNNCSLHFYSIMLAGFYGRGIYNANSRKKQYSSELKVIAQSERHQRNSKQLFDRLKNSLKAITDVVSEVRLMYKENEEDDNIKQNIVRAATSSSPSTNEAKQTNASKKNSKKTRSEVLRGAGDKLLNKGDDKKADNDNMNVDDNVDDDVVKALHDYDSIVDNLDIDDIADGVNEKKEKGDQDGDDYNGDFEEFDGEKTYDNDGDGDDLDDYNHNIKKKHIDSNDTNKDDNIDEDVKYSTNDNDPNVFEPLTITPSNDDTDGRGYHLIIHDSHNDDNDDDDDELLDNKGMYNEKKDERITKKDFDDKYDDEDFNFDGEMLTAAYVYTV
jgi:hypothetical protein